MVLQEIEIFDFKSINHLKLEIKSNQLCFVGINESGKTSIIDAISYLNVSKEFTSSQLNKNAKNYPNGFPFIAGLFSLNLESDSSLIKYITDSIQYEKSLNLISIKEAYIQLKRWGNGFNNISIAISDGFGFIIDVTNSLKEEIKKSEFLDNFFTLYYPVIEYFEKEELLIEPANIEDLNGSDSKFETIRRLLHIAGCTDFNNLDSNNHLFFATFIKGIEHKLNVIFRQHYKQDQSISITIIPAGNNKLVVVIGDASGKSYALNERSPGFQYYFSFLINKLYYNLVYENRNIIFLLDEPGNSLHPKGARDLLKTFKQISIKNQILYTTHNPFLAMRDNVDGLVHVYKNADKGTNINNKPWLKKYQTLRRELGILLNDSFLIGEVNLLVEGITEKSVLHEIFQSEKYAHLEWLNIYNIDGVGNIAQTLNFLGDKNLDLKGIVLLDSDGEAQKEKDKPIFKNTMATEKWDFIEINHVLQQTNLEHLKIYFHRTYTLRRLINIVTL